MHSKLAILALAVVCLLVQVHALPQCPYISFVTSEPSHKILYWIAYAVNSPPIIKFPTKTFTVPPITITKPPATVTVVKPTVTVTVKPTITLKPTATIPTTKPTATPINPFYGFPAVYTVGTPSSVKFPRHITFKRDGTFTYKTDGVLCADMISIACPQGRGMGTWSFTPAIKSPRPGIVAPTPAKLTLVMVELPAKTKPVVVRQVWAVGSAKGVGNSLKGMRLIEYSGPNGLQVPVDARDLTWVA
ncbi:hypothetical protein BC828DRAFT_375941 [Blastocladiella britannica]|nr:hypothetical protein BC828DRAFT_375941 [Blastocladiella britannica]